MTCLALESLNFLAMEHVDVFIAADIVALHLILILVLIVCLRSKGNNIYIYISKMYDKKDQ